MLRLSCVKLFSPSFSNINDTSSYAFLGESQGCKVRGRERFSAGETNGIPYSQFKGAGLEEMCGLKRNGTFEVPDISKIGEDTWLLGSRYTAKISPANRQGPYDSRLAAQNYEDFQARNNATKS